MPRLISPPRLRWGNKVMTRLTLLIPIAALTAACMADPAVSEAPAAAVNTIPANTAEATPAPLPAIAAIPAPQGLGAFSLTKAPDQGALIRGRVPIGTVRLSIDGRAVPFAADGGFLVGFGRDFGAFVSLVAVLQDGQSVTERLPVAKHAWNVQSLPGLKKIPPSSGNFEARRPGELAQMNAARKIVTDANGWQQAFIWPAKGRISGVFGSQRIYAGQPGSPHSGTDIAGGAGAPVVSPADGVVILAASAPFTLEGNLLLVDHGAGLSSAFLHLSRIDVKVGQAVKQGQLIGAIGMTGRATGPHLHWALRWFDDRIDAQSFVPPMVVR